MSWWIPTGEVIDNPERSTDLSSCVQCKEVFETYYDYSLRRITQISYPDFPKYGLKKITCKLCCEG
tara:strand:+ start:1767 stop:1964 length:198 start_codon:yes stop_codon:yes gene_type:complete